KLKVLGDVIEV
nr:Chain A, Alpha-crystallin B chain [Homo sapiens]3SGP_B Chain B, Alpha-crystallin B chain [Homo sapiens]3SGP_C Chain C, Alpha-crystallin B chain [Homo sapiens]3SGP_D Chain D, Alpha-crystallin B chain [Homo sapiens]